MILYSCHRFAVADSFYSRRRKCNTRSTARFNIGKQNARALKDQTIYRNQDVIGNRHNRRGQQSDRGDSWHFKIKHSDIRKERLYRGISTSLFLCSSARACLSSSGILRRWTCATWRDELNAESHRQISDADQIDDVSNRYRRPDSLHGPALVRRQTRCVAETHRPWSRTPWATRNQHRAN